MKKTVLCQNAMLDPVATGANLKAKISDAGYRVSEIQEFLCLSCPQPIYRWFRGKSLPTLQHLCALADLLDVSVDDLLVRRFDNEHIISEFAIFYCVDLERSHCKSQVLDAYLVALTPKDKQTA